MSHNKHRFALVEIRGYSERTLHEADSLEELIEVGKEKTGQGHQDDRVVFPGEGD